MKIVDKKCVSCHERVGHLNLSEFLTKQ